MKISTQFFVTAVTSTYHKGTNAVKDQLSDLGLPFFAAINFSTDVSCEWIFIILVLNDRSAAHI
jgi:hypothetical protein